MQKPSDRTDGSNVIWVDFSAGRAENWFLLMAGRCDDEAGRATPKTAAKLRRLAASYREKADRG